MFEGVLKKTKKSKTKHNCVRRIGIILTICIWAACIYTGYSMEIPLNNVYASLWDGEKLYGMDRSEGSITVFSSDLDGRNSRTVSVYGAGDENFRIGESLSFTEKGQCQVTFLEYTGSADIKRLTGICNFETGTLDDVHEEETFIDKVPEGAYLSGYGPEGDIWYVDQDGSLWRVQDNGEEQCVFSNDGTKIGTENTAYVLGNQGLYFYNVQAQAVYQIPYENPVLVKTDLFSDYDRETYGILYQMDEMEDGAFTASFRQEDSRLLPVVLGQTHTLLTSIVPSFGNLALQIVWNSILLFGTVLILWGLYAFVMKMFGNVFPTSLKLICFALPVAAAGYGLLDTQVTSILRSQMEKQEQTRMYSNGESLVKLISEEQLFSEKDNVYNGFLTLLSSYYDKTMMGDQVYHVEGRSAGNISAWESNYDLFLEKNGNFYMVEARMLNCIPSEYAYGSLAADYMKECADKKEPVLVFQNDILEGNNLTLYMPVLDENLQVQGIVRGMVTEKGILSAIQEEKDIIMGWILLFLAVMLAVLTANAVISLMPLIKLQRAAADMAEGKAGTWKKVRGAGEVAQVTGFFIQMSESIAAYLKRINKLKNAYEPFIPESLIQVFGEKDIRDIEPGKETEQEAAILVLESYQLKWETDQSDEHKFSVLNQIYCTVNDTMEKGGGIVERFTEAGAVILFKDGVGAALKAAGEGLKMLKGAYFFGAGIEVGSLKFGVIGTEDRMEVMTISPHTQLAVLLNQISCRYKAGALLTREAAEMASKEIGEEGIRFFGYLGTEGADWEKKEIYEYFLPLGQEQARLRTISRDDFEKGIKYLGEKRYKEGRDCFAQVLRVNRDDLAAARYFQMCDRKMQGLDEKEPDFIEAY